MTRAFNLYSSKTANELASMASDIRSEPLNRNEQGGIELYTPKARKMLSDIAWAITYHLDDARTTPTKD